MLYSTRRQWGIEQVQHTEMLECVESVVVMIVEVARMHGQCTTLCGQRSKQRVGGEERVVDMNEFVFLAVITERLEYIMQCLCGQMFAAIPEHNASRLRQRRAIVQHTHRIIPGNGQRRRHLIA